MKKNKIGIIGNGFVGEAQAFAFSTIADIFIYDIDPLKSMNSLKLIHDCDYVFVCVPTPMNKKGKQDFSYVENVFKYAKSKPIYIIKSTILPASTDKLSEYKLKLKEFSKIS